MIIKVHNPHNLPTIDYHLVKPLQGTLKDLTEANYKKLKKVLERRGFTTPLFIWRNGDDYWLMDGHQRVRVMEAEHAEPTQLPYVLIHADNEQDAKAQLLEITSQYGTITQEGFDEFIADLPETEVVEAVHFDALPFLGQRNEVETVEDEPPEPEPDTPTVSEPGEVYQLGPHRVMVGDAGDPDAVKKLFVGLTADVLFTSPPYAAQREYNIGSFDWDELMDKVFTNVPASDDTQVFVNLGLVHKDNEVTEYWRGWRDRMGEWGWRKFGWYVWDQGWGMMGDWGGRLAPSFEFIFHFNKQSLQPAKTKAKHEENVLVKDAKAKGLRNKDGSFKKLSSPTKSLQPNKILDSVIRINRATSTDGNHPAVFPVGLPAEFIAAYTQTDDIVYDPFLGSGTTLIAAEQLGRVCFGIDIDPSYVDITRKRYHKLMTGSYDGWDSVDNKVEA